MRKKEKKTKNRDKNFYTIFGYILIIIGISLPLYGFWNMSYRNISAKSGYEKFVQESKNSAVDAKGIEDYNNKIKNNNIVDPFTAEDYSATYDFYKENPDEVFAYLKIPKLGITKPIYLDASYEHLDMGVAHIDGTSLPVGGVNRRSVIAGHRGWYRDLMFFNLHKLDVGDDVTIVRGDESLKYKVSDTEVILPTDWEALQPREGVDMLTLLTCERLRPPRPKRLLVNCVRVEDAPVAESAEDIKVDSSVKGLDILIYVVTIVLLALLVLTIFKFIKYIL
ncbi:class C sortase [Peptoniphilus sp.]|jgi:sortase A|uniref:class C sortase n=1 Tax=Peptoniphilus sp. TaxID=1971214 RepID=UPI003D922635